MAAKCANSFVIVRRNDELKPIHAGVGVPGRAIVLFVHADKLPELNKFA